MEKLNGRLVLSLRDNKSSDNEKVRNFRLCFLFSIFLLANSRSSVWCPCWRKCKLTDVARTEWDKIFDRPDYSVWRSSSFFSPVSLNFPICSFNVMCLQLDYVNFANLIQISGNDLSAKPSLRHSAGHVFTQRDAQVTSYLKPSNTRLLCLSFANVIKLHPERLFCGNSSILFLI